ncbi:MAG TPA: MarR family winged helix-turn-helix transcriptional regulator [Bryobacteraceae bacterium]|nr:MarR family winged helix-turn-helix transcriptional regulator [Bryobacteraceae bacterium]
MTQSNLGPCACSQIRRTARKLSTFYDEFLSPAGLTITQYSILAKISRARSLSRSELAAQLGMDRTTLTRNLQPLELARFLTTSTGDDRRRHLLSMSSLGQRKLRQSQPLWEEAQRAFSVKLGGAALRELRQLLTAAEAAAAMPDE